MDVGFDLLGEGGERSVAEGGEAGVGGGKIGGVVHALTVGGVGEHVGLEWRRKRHRGRIGFDEEAVGGERGEDGAFFRGAVGEEAPVEGKISTEGGEFAGELKRTVVGVQEKAAGGAAEAEFGSEWTPGVEAMEGGGKIAGGGEIELPAEGGELFVERRATEAGEARIVGARAVKDPRVEADFAEGGRRRWRRRRRVEVGEELVAPRGAGVAHVPRVEAVRGKNPRVRAGEGGDGGPIGFAGAVDDGAAEREGGEVGEDAVAVGREPGVLQVIMRVGERRQLRRHGRRRGGRGRRCGCGQRRWRDRGGGSGRGGG